MSNDKLAALLRECLADYSHPHFTDRGGMADRIRAALQAHAAEAAQAQAQVPGAKYPDDGCGDEDSYNAGWNACRDAMLAAAPQQAAEPKGWMASDNTGRVIDAKAKTAGSRAAATASATAIYSIPLYTHPQPQELRNENIAEHCHQAGCQMLYGGIAPPNDTQDAKDASLRDSRHLYKNQLQAIASTSPDWLVRFLQEK